MKTRSQKHNWIVDAILFAGFLLVFFLDLTGLTWHQWLGVFVGVLSGYHLLIHWNWIKSVTQRFLKRTSHQARLYYIVDASLLVGFLLILVTGVVISTWLNLTLDNYSVWLDIHVTVSILALILIVMKIGLHWRWIVNTAKRYILFSKPALQSWRAPQPVKANLQISRREFISLMGIVGVASFVAVSSALSSRQDTLANNAESDDLEVPEIPEVGAEATSSNALFENSSSDDCYVECRRGCSYPGKCRRYVDRNQNSVCDFTECV